ncbi:MAG: apolipoprotein N-acyltransferase, partial [Epsilonproteobacteria bacterium]|nr:apolipoprotein N-acyltransferase [Campylobacterota bacterium]
NLRQYFTIIFIIRGFFVACLLSLSIYLSYFGIEIFILNTLLAVAGFYLVLKENRIVLFYTGFFIGIFWFYWIGFSFRYYGFPYLIPLMILFTAFLYGFLFWLIGLSNSPFIRALFITGLSYIHPMGFNWLVLEVTLVNSYIGIKKWQFLAFLMSIAIISDAKKYYKLLAIPLIFSALDFSYKSAPKMPNLKIYLSSPHLSQNIKWNQEYLPKIVNSNLQEIKKAIKKGYDLIILSESIFPLYLDQTPSLLNTLSKLSKDRAIVTGSLSFKDNKPYNSTYYFIDGKLTIADKVILVPFGEEIPLPKFIAKFINKIFFDGASDYATAKKPIDIRIKDYIFRNAICYEATREELYKNNPPYMIAISNNAWFTPSIEPVLQKLLLKYFSKKYNIIIFHSANMGISTIIKPTHALSFIKQK